MSSIPWASYFRADHSILHPLVIFVGADHITLYPSIVLESYFCVVHLLGELFSCRPFIVLSVYPFGELFLCRPSLGESYFRAGHLILHPLASYFKVYHITLHPSIPMSSYLCATHPLGELFSCRPFNCPIRLSLWRVIFASSIPWASYFRADHLTLHPSIPLASYFCATNPLGELVLYCSTLGRAILVPTI